MENNLFEFDNSYRHSEGVNVSDSCLPATRHCEEGQSPDAAIQNQFTTYNSPFTVLIGTDEAGRGPGAGGVFASAVYFPEITNELIEKLSGLNDSKKLSKQKREELYDIIIENSINSTVCIEVEEIEKINILNASLKAMKLACENVIRSCSPLEGEPKSIDFEGGTLIEQTTPHPNPPPQGGRKSPQNELKNAFVLVDGNKLIKDFSPSLEFLRLANSPRTSPSPLKGEGNIAQKCIIKGDGKSASIAAASILAKVTRDRYMHKLHEKFPQYNWIKNAGYLTKEHLDAIDKYGITPHHRKSFLKKHEARQLSFEDAEK